MQSHNVKEMWLPVSLALPRKWHIDGDKAINGCNCCSISKVFFLSKEAIHEKAFTLGGAADFQIWRTKNWD